MYLFFDTETTGLPKNLESPLSDHNNWPRMVQIAWLLYNDNRELVESESYIIFPEDFAISAQAAAIHGITNTKAKFEGTPIKEVLDKFLETFKKATHLIGHNLEFDYKIVGSELIRLGTGEYTWYKELNKRERICTMQDSRVINYCALQSHRDDYKWPKLSELYFKIFNNVFIEEHNAKKDIWATAQCFFKLVDFKILNYPIKYMPRYPLVPYQKDGKWGYIDQLYKMVIPCQYSSAYMFSNGLAVVTKTERNQNNKTLFGCIDINGEVVIPLEYYKILKYKNEFDKLIILFQEFGNLGSFSVDDDYGSHWYTDYTGGETGIIDNYGNIQYTTIYDSVIMNEFREIIFGRITSMEKELRDIFFQLHSYGLTRNLEEDKKIILNNKYNGGFVLKDGLRRFYKDGLYGFMNIENRVIIPAIYKKANDFSEGLAFVTVKLSGEVGFINTNGEMVISKALKNGSATDFNEGFSLVVTHSSRFLIDKEGKEWNGTKGYIICSNVQNGNVIVKRVHIRNYDEYEGEEEDYQHTKALDELRMYHEKFDEYDDDKYDYDNLEKSHILEHNLEIAKRRLEVSYYGLIDCGGSILIPLDYKMICRTSDNGIFFAESYSLGQGYISYSVSCSIDYNRFILDRGGVFFNFNSLTEVV